MHNEKLIECKLINYDNGLNVGRKVLVNESDIEIYGIGENAEFDRNFKVSVMVNSRPKIKNVLNINLEKA